MFFRPTIIALYYVRYFLHIYWTNMWFKIAEKTDAKYIGSFLL